MQPGTLYVVATPLGHLGDLTQRAADILRSVPVVAAEDTRRSRTLLEHLGARPKLISYHAHSDETRTETLLDILADGRDIALVTDAGTPVLSDPGADLIAAVRAAGCPVVPVPGPAALTAALSASGLPGDRFLFLGFLPRKGPERERLLQRAATEEWTVIFYEAPQRLTDLLDDLVRLAGAERQVVVARELTKIYEEFRSGPLAEVLAHFTSIAPRGELTVLLRGTGHAPPPEDRTPEAEALARTLLAEGHSRKEVARMVTEQLGVARNDAYRLVTGLE